MRFPAALALVGLLWAGAASSQATLSSLAQGETALRETDDLRLEKFADFSEIRRMKIGTELEIGDLLSGVSGTLAVELSCGDASILRFSGGFRVLINPPGDNDCAVDDFADPSPRAVVHIVDVDARFGRDRHESTKAIVSVLRGGAVRDTFALRKLAACPSNRVHSK